uniref:Uncharacterized protein n=1 Tax=Anguilla anguilla TaxID=7936 RepID=A0A0E9REX5_ANGAN
MCFNNRKSTYDTLTLHSFS